MKKTTVTAELAELAAKINAFLSKLEAKQPAKQPAAIRLVSPWARVSGRFVTVSYVSYHPSTKLCLEAAKAYADKMSEKNYRHYEALRGTQWDRDPTGLGKAARKRSIDRVNSERLNSEKRARIAQAESEADGMEIAAEFVVGMSTSPKWGLPEAICRRILKDVAGEIRTAAKARVAAAGAAVDSAAAGDDSGPAVDDPAPDPADP